MVKKGLSLKTKLVLSISLVVFVIGLMTAVSVSVYTKQILTKQENEKFRLNTVAKANEIEKVLENSQAIVKTIAGLPDIIAFMDIDIDTFPDKEHVLLHLNNFNIEQAYSAIYLMDRDGNTLVSTNPDFVGKNYGFRSYFQKPLTTGLPSINVARGVTSKQLGYYFSTPIKSKTSDILGVVVVKMNPDYLYELIGLNESKIGNIDYMLVDSYGVVLQSNKAKKIFSSLGQISFDDLEILKKERIYEGLDIQPMDYQIIQNNLKSDIKFNIYELYDESDNEREIVFIAPIMDSSFFFLLESEFEVVNDAINRIVILLLVAILLFTLVAVVVVTAIVSRFVSPIKDLQIFTKNVMAGHLKQKITVKTNDEFGELAENLNEMASRLVQSQEETEGKIKERTEKLEALNQSMIGRELKMLELKKEINLLKKNKDNN